MKVEVSCAEHGSVASASHRDGSWQLQVHLLIARRAARSAPALLPPAVVHKAATPADPGGLWHSHTAAQEAPTDKQ